MTVPFLFGCLVTTPETYHQAGIRRGSVTQRSTLRGTTSETLQARIPGSIKLQDPGIRMPEANGDTQGKTQGLS